ncbi:MAG: TrbI/VirB10 family protein [Acidaminococcaceae bacterium]|nr:TrbI/VirB10 family protein [Acidaminococcaceae bacterium]
MGFLTDFKRFINRKNNKNDEELINEDAELDNRYMQDSEEEKETDKTDYQADPNAGLIIHAEEEKDTGTRLQSKRIMLMAAAVVILGFALLFASGKKPVQQQQNPDLSINTSKTNNPAASLPDNYGQLSKYEQAAKPKETPQPKQAIPQPVQRSYVQATPPPQVARNNNAELDRKKQILSSPISFKLDPASQQSQNQNTGSNYSIPTVYNNSEQAVFSNGNRYVLNAGTVIPATMLTGATSDSPQSDVVAQIRQDVYDSLTGEHLLIPQGARLIGQSGSAGSRGNKRLGVVFTRIIFPDGRSINLPKQAGIDGAGYPGLRDKYDTHSSTLYRTAFMSAIFAAAAQSATGNTSGTDTRSPGQEAVSGAVADVLRTAKTIVDRDANMNPTIEIRPGYRFSVFINQDFALNAYCE